MTAPVAPPVGSSPSAVAADGQPAPSQGNAPDVEIVNVPMSTWQRDSMPPRWGVLEPTPLPSGEPLRLWPDAMADYAPLLLRETAAGGSRPAQ